MAQSSNEELAGFTLRIPKQLKDQIDTRAKLQHRTRNAEIVHLLTQAIDESVARDIELKDRFNRQKPSQA